MEETMSMLQAEEVAAVVTSSSTTRAALTALQKCTAALHQLAYGMTIDTIDEYLKLGKTIALKCLEYYCLDTIGCFVDEFLRRPTATDN
jgi:hypothetical protein